MALANKSTETKDMAITNSRDTAAMNSKGTAATEDDAHAEAIRNNIRGSFLHYSPSYSSSIITWFEQCQVRLVQGSLKHYVYHSYPLR